MILSRRAPSRCGQPAAPPPPLCCGMMAGFARAEVGWLGDGDTMGIRGMNETARTNPVRQANDDPWLVPGCAVSFFGDRKMEKLKKQGAARRSTGQRRLGSFSRARVHHARVGCLGSLKKERAQGGRAPRLKLATVQRLFRAGLALMNGDA